MRRLLAICVHVNMTVAVVLSVILFVLPVVMIIRALDDPALRGEGIPSFAFRWHRALSPKYEKWARGRVASGGGAVEHREYRGDGVAAVRLGLLPVGDGGPAGGGAGESGSLPGAAESVCTRGHRGGGGSRGGPGPCRLGQAALGRRLPRDTRTSSTGCCSSVR